MPAFRHRILLAAAPVLFVAAAATGCAAEPAPSAGAPAPGGPAASSPARPAEGSSQPAEGSSPPAKGEGAAQTTGKDKVPACRAADVKSTVTAQGPLTTGAEARAIISLENVSSRTCRIEGWPTVTLVNAAGEATPATATKVEQPGPAVRIDLKPGRSAPAGLKWTQCDKGDQSCPVGNTLEIGLPGATGEPATLEDFPAPETSGIAMKKVQVGPLQLSRQGVVAW